MKRISSFVMEKSRAHSVPIALKAHVVSIADTLGHCTMSVYSGCAATDSGKTFLLRRTKLSLKHLYGEISFHVSTTLPQNNPFRTWATEALEWDECDRLESILNKISDSTLLRLLKRSKHHFRWCHVRVYRLSRGPPFGR